ncbi:hypothetical protein DFQ01_14449 [Paenibacillus cellulosilyticus]|uniref:Holin n=1 Tax=Paenibacillus cellulosilyticus TaxID=375489 RepID=A0A2V2YN58_9BACL|nr:hypothetical protein [Paenibacillus cellulosilyticus]PWV90273.1 hypothetical protein DFQ01_14449 [Paenibacillus cellulosilyticus]
MDTDQILMLTPCVAALVGVLKQYKVPRRHYNVAALAFAAMFVVVPDAVQSTLAAIVVIGLGSVGLYKVSKGDSDASESSK